YKPFLQTASCYPKFKIMFHISGCLLDYFEEKHPEIIDLIRKMVSRGQVELMGGGYYEPILTAIPERDARGQITMMSGYIKKTFDFNPKGMWLAERVWDPDIARLIYSAGMRYLILDDEHLRRAGVKDKDMHGYFLTGSGKEKLAVFPSDKTLRYAIPFRTPEGIIDYFRKSFEKRKGNLFTYGDDGEKFGEWPGTYEWVFEKQWLSRFFDILKANEDWIELVHFSDYLKGHRPAASLKIPQGSYREMMEWSGGNWLNFLSKYPEVNQMHKRMVYTSNRVASLEKRERRNKVKSRKLEAARRELYRAQTNCSYWHGVFGGIYLYHLRKAVYSHLIEADKIVDGRLYKNKKSWLDIKKLDFDMDSKDEFIIENEKYSLFIDPFEGGIIKEADYKPLSFNLANTLSRRKESYHQKILDPAVNADNGKVSTIHDDFRTIDPSFKNIIVYDKFPRCFMRSYFVKKDLKISDFINSSYEEVGDFASDPYDAAEKDKGVILERDSIVSGIMIGLRKEIRLSNKNEIEMTFCYRKKGSVKTGVLLGIEFNVTMPDLNSDNYAYSCDGKRQKGINEEGQGFPLSSFGISDSSNSFNISFNFSKKPKRIFYFPVRTVSQSERAYELNYQCSCVFSLWGIDSGNRREGSFKIVFKKDVSSHEDK
ncbi:MAG: DUF1926 domain-containing protein, partial [Candidatus Omnitrophica bacterium]|nr:DUF1926 domain-containing protein [Candidatus Omnitrophota bacterium]